MMSPSVSTRYHVHRCGPPTYELLDVTFVGGTALRSFYIGHRGRFSFDLDFDVAEGGADLLAEEIDGMTT